MRKVFIGIILGYLLAALASPTEVVAQMARLAMGRTEGATGAQKAWAVDSTGAVKVKVNP